MSTNCVSEDFLRRVYSVSVFCLKFMLSYLHAVQRFLHCHTPFECPEEIKMERVDLLKADTISVHTFVYKY